MSESKDTNTTPPRMLSLDLIEENEGQLFGLPQNPRSIEEGKYAKLKENISKYPELLSWRSLLVYPLDNGNYIIVGGNMRYRALKELGYSEAPVFVIPKTTPVDRLKAYTILDNNGFGDWDWSLLEEEWSVEMLDDWGIECDFMLQDIDYISDINEGGLKGVANSETDVFAATFNIPKEHKASFDDYVKIKGKQNIVELIIAEVCQDAEVK